MREEKTNQGLKSQFLDSRQSVANQKDDSDSQQYFALANPGEQTKRFKVKLRSGMTYSFPYSLLPIYQLHDPSLLDIICYQLKITIKGTHLEEIEKVLSEEKMVWIRESTTGHHHGNHGVFVSDITVSGKALEDM